MRPPLDGTVHLVTGASSGLGVDFARLLAPRARVLVLVARRVDRLEALATELRAAHPALTVRVEPCDLADAAATEAMMARVEAAVGTVDVLINNAGLGDFGCFDLASWPKLEHMVKVDVLALTQLAHRVLPGMKARGAGGILNVSSGFGLEWLPGFAGYTAAKHYVSALSEAMRLELADDGIVVTQLCPGPVATEFLAVAGNPIGAAPPWLFMTSTRCTRAGVEGFARGRAMIVPGLSIKLLMLMGKLTPRWMKRLVYVPLARWLRRRELGARGQGEQAKVQG